MKEICITTSGHSRRCMNSVSTLQKKALIPQLLINHKDHTLLLFAITVEENTNAFQRGSSTQSFSLLRTFFSRQVLSSSTMWSEKDLLQSTFYEQYAEVVWIQCSQGRLQQAWRPPRTKQYKKKPQNKKKNKGPEQFSEETKSNP